jgi:hypothetical protein
VIHATRVCRQSGHRDLRARPQSPLASANRGAPSRPGGSSIRAQRDYRRRHPDSPRALKAGPVAVDVLDELRHRRSRKWP